ncbi:MAG: recombinase family protein [Propionibacteriaceae bacterium]|nr:recombinase family protein [Propionibacteriaceae bacterium]
MTTAIIEPIAPTTTGVPPADRAEEPIRAVCYIRVSTKEQATRGGREEGFSIPAQREAIRKAAADAGALIVEEFVEAGESGTTMERRPELKRMLAYVRDHQVDRCYVHKLDRLARNREDDVAINLALRQCGVTLVSCTENIDATATGALVHGIMASISEFYSRNLSNEVKKGLRQKALNGGTPNRAPLGYFNTRARDAAGREYRTVEVDPARAPLVAWAFEAYATGQWTLRDLADELTLRGLTTVPTKKRPGKPVAVSTLQAVLRNPYYTGVLLYNGARHRGTHDPLVKPLVFEKAQEVLDSHRGCDARQRKHPHYLKGLITCQCGAKMSIELSRSRNGDIYPYFYCLGRHRKQNHCQMQAILVSTVERLVEDHFAQISLTRELAEALEDMAIDIFSTIDDQSAGERRQLDQRRRDLEDAELKLIHMFYDDAITMPALKKEQHRVATQLAEVTARLDAYQAGCDDAKLRIKAYLALAANCGQFYKTCDDTKKRLCYQAFFTQITITEDHRVETQFTGAYDTIMDPEVRLHADYWQRTKQLHPAILDQDAPRPDDMQGSVVRISEVWWV